MENGLTDLKRWLTANQERFSAENYTTEDIANLAIAAGFNRQAVAQWQISKLFKEAI